MLFMCLVGTQGQKGIAAFCEGKVFYTFKSKGSFVAACYTQDAVFLSLAKFLWTEKTFLKEKGAILSEKEEDE